jgi:hypothetical protein
MSCGCNLQLHSIDTAGVDGLCMLTCVFQVTAKTEIKLQP